MKKFILILILLSFSSLSFAELVRVIYRPDGGVSISGQNTENTLTSQDFNRIQDRDPVLKGLSYDDIDSSLLPDKKDRNYWTGKKGEGVRVDTKKRDADKLIKANKEKALDDKLKVVGLTKEDLKECLK